MIFRIFPFFSISLTYDHLFKVSFLCDFTLLVHISLTIFSVSPFLNLEVLSEVFEAEVAILLFLYMSFTFPCSSYFTISWFLSKFTSDNPVIPTYIASSWSNTLFAPMYLSKWESHFTLFPSICNVSCEFMLGQYGSTVKLSPHGLFIVILLFVPSIIFFPFFGIKLVNLLLFLLYPHFSVYFCFTSTIDSLPLNGSSPWGLIFLSPTLTLFCSGGGLG